MNGGDFRPQVLQHIQDNGYWYKTDQNDTIRSSGTRNEKTWRNLFSYERQHLVSAKCMRPVTEVGNGRWEITDIGRELFKSLAEKAKSLEYGERVCFTSAFCQKLFNSEIPPEIAADSLLLEQIFNTAKEDESPPPPLLNGPLPKGPMSNRLGAKNTYLRDPVVSRHALMRARHRCEIDASHLSFTRRNSSDPYMEPHHLIPMSMTDRFGLNLDREQNIFSLCSNCHNQIHYGTKNDVRLLLSILFLSRKNEICSILDRPITLDEVYRLYNI
jgi:5-methylcytosine-specific restriction endonuclease McrA